MESKKVTAESKAPSLARGVVEQLMSLVFECAPNGVVLTRPSGQIVLVNAECERMFGYSRTDLIDSPVETLLPARFRQAHATLRRGHAVESRFGAMGEGREFVGLHSDGTEFPMEVGVSSTRTPVGIMVVETIVNISVRKRIELMFQKVVESAPCALLMIDASGLIVLINPQATFLFGYSRAEMVGSPLEMLLPQRLRAFYLAHRSAFTLAPHIRQLGASGELMARRKDGSEFSVEIGLNPVPSDAGALVLATVTDITQRSKMQRELRQVNFDLEEFIYAASHDLKSPLQGIADLVDWIEEGLGGKQTDEVERNLARVTDRVQRLGVVIDGLLAYAHAGTVSLQPESIDLRELINGVLTLMAIPPSFSITLHIEFGQLLTNRAPLGSVLQNILGNAVKHHDQAGGKIAIHVEAIERFCVFTIADDGPGIPQTAQQRIFRMFQTAGGIGGEHSGIGLALSKRLVEAHGGHIEVLSENGNRGTAFKVWWPRVEWRGAHE